LLSWPAVRSGISRHLIRGRPQSKAIRDRIASLYASGKLQLL
jgi:hypothetical protein